MKSQRVGRDAGLRMETGELWEGRVEVRKNLGSDKLAPSFQKRRKRFYKKGCRRPCLKPIAIGEQFSKKKTM